MTNASTNSTERRPILSPGTAPDALLDALALRAASQPDRAAFLVDGSRSITFGEWDRRATSIAHGLAAIGCARGDRVGLLFAADDWIDYAVAYIGALRAGTGVLHLSEELPRDEIERRLNQCNVSGIVHSRSIAPPARRWAATVESVDQGKTGPVGVDVQPTDVSDILYTSGATTGVPKGVVVLHSENALHRDPGKARETEASGYFLNPFSIGTGSSQAIITFALTSAATIVVLTRLDPGHICEIVARLRVDNIMMTPGTVAALVNSGMGQKYDLSSVRTLASGAAALPASLAKRLMAMFPNAKLTQYYVSLESVPGMAVSVFDPNRPYAVGLPSHGTEIKIADAAGRPLPTGEVGEVFMRTAGHKRYYENDAELNACVFVDGWVRTGDVGYLDEESCLYFFDRSADVIHTGGRKVSTLRIENALFEHPGVQEACAVGVPDPELGQRIAVALVLAPGTSVDDVKGFLRTRLPAHELPAEYIVDEFLPRGIIGKVLKREVRRWLADGDGEDARRARRRRYW